MRSFNNRPDERVVGKWQGVKDGANLCAGREPFAHSRDDALVPPPKPRPCGVVFSSTYLRYERRLKPENRGADA